MAEPDAEPIAEAPARGGFFSRFVAGVKRIKPGEWALIGVGLLGIIVYIIWYRRQQASSSGYNALVPGGGTSNPNWGSAQAQPGGTFDSEIAALLTQLASQNAATVPNTTVTSAGGGVSGGAAGGVGGIAGGAQGSGLPLTGQPATMVGAPASSGSGITQQPNNQAPVQNTTAIVQGAAPAMIAPAAPVNNPVGMTAQTGLVGVPTGSTVNNTPVRAPANVTPMLSPAGGAQTYAATRQAPAPVYHVNVVAPIVTHATAPVPAPVAPTKPAGGVSRPLR